MAPASPLGVERALARLRGIPQPLEKFLLLRELQAKDPPVFQALLNGHTEEILPFIYTPTIGEACQKYHKIPVAVQGLYITADDAGSILGKLQAWKEQEIDVVVVTDGERILGLGDLGAGGMGIPEGKILLYTAAAGVHPDRCLPVMLDVGTNNRRLLADRAYKGLRRERIRGEAYDALVGELMAAMAAWRPHVLIQFEDFANQNAFRLLDRYRGTHCCFNDDIQGTACVALAGLLAALRVTGGALTGQRVLFLGAGEAGTGIGELIALALSHWHGIPLADARGRCFYLDSKGLVCKSRGGDLQHHKVPFAHDVPFQKDLLPAIRQVRPTVLVGVSTQAGAFSREVVELMCQVNERPVIFPLSNPTSMSECTFADAHAWSDGQVVFASGSPFDPVLGKGGEELFPAQANNAYVFPAVGLAASLVRARGISDGTFLTAASALAAMSTPEELAQGRLFPRFSRIREVSTAVAAAVAMEMCREGAGRAPAGMEAADEARWRRHVAAAMYRPEVASRL